LTDIAVRLAEWETVLPTSGSPTEGVGLGDDPSVRDLARRLSESRMLDVQELRTGLSVRSTSFVGRVRLGGVEITVVPKLRSETLLTLLPTANPAAGCCLERVTLSAQGIVSGVFRVERTDRLGLTTTSEMAKMTPISRGIFAPVADEAVLLAAELQVFGRDLVYEAALAFAAVLAPDLATMEHA